MSQDILKIDPTTLTVSRIKALLSEEGVELPTTKEPKSAYVDLFNAYKAKLLEKTQSPQPPAQTTTPPRKRKLRHSINVFQSGAKKQLTDDEGSDQQKKIKKRKSLGNDEKSNNYTPSPTTTTTTTTNTTAHQIPSSLSPPRYVLPSLPVYSHPHQSIANPTSRPTSSQLHAPVPSIIPPRTASQSSHQPQAPLQPQSSYQSSQPSHLRKYQLPPTLFQPQQKSVQASAKQQPSTYISPLYFSNPPTTTTTVTNSVSRPGSTASDQVQARRVLIYSLFFILYSLFLILNS
jgi:hypothetical protein